MNKPINRFIDFSNLPRLPDGKIDWTNASGTTLSFEFDDFKGFFTIVKKVAKSKVEVNYNNKISIMNYESIKNCHLARMFIGALENDLKHPIPYVQGKYADEGDYILTRNNSVIKVIKREPNSITYKCMKCDCVNKTTISKLGVGVGCPVCINQKIIKGVNDMWITNPDMAIHLAVPEDGYKYSDGSHKKVDWKCYRCGDIVHGVAIKQNKAVGYVLCPLCSRSESYPNKFINEVFKMAKIHYGREVSKPEWFDGVRRRYDFLIDDTFLEIDGGMGHGNTDYKDFSKEEQLRIDRLKDEAAENHGYKIIRINCNYPNERFQFMKNICLENKYLNSIIDMKMIDFEQIHYNIETSTVDKCCELWNNSGLNVKEIAEQLNINKETVRRSLKVGEKIGKTYYGTASEHWKRSHKKED